jgi:hypothetical protein
MFIYFSAMDATLPEVLPEVDSNTIFKFATVINIQLLSPLFVLLHTSLLYTLLSRIPLSKFFFSDIQRSFAIHVQEFASKVRTKQKNKRKKEKKEKKIIKLTLFC